MESTVTIELARQLYIIQSRLDSSTEAEAEAEAEAETSMQIRRQHPIELMVCLFSHSDLLPCYLHCFPRSPIWNEITLSQSLTLQQ